MVYRFGTCLLDTQQHQLQRCGQPIRLRPKVFQVLCYLLEHRDRMVLKAELYAHIWPQAYISEATLESTLREVRQGIGDGKRAPQLIQTVYGYGYRFVGAVEEVADPAAETKYNTPGMPPGAAVPQPQAPSAAVPLAPAPGSTVAPHGPESVGGRDQEGGLPSGDRLQLGERKLVTVLCAAPVTRLVGEAQSDADTWYRQLSRLYTLAQPVVQRYAGMLQPVLGDHIVAVFGVPVAQEDHAERAVLAALALQRHMREASLDGRTHPGDGLELRVGLDTGPVALGRIGEATAGLAVVGETVMRALALQAQAAPGAILCSDATAHLVQEAVPIEAVTSVPMAGKPTPVAAYMVVGPHRRHPFRTLARRELAPFVGRHHELATLRALLARVEEGRGQVMGMIGEPGVGKSRLCYEFICGSITPPWRILEAQGTAYGQATPYLPIIDLLKGYFRLDDRDDPMTVHDKVTTTLHRLENALTPTTPAFLRLLDVPVEDPSWRSLDPPQRRQCTLDALKRILLRESQVQPLLLVVENLHWIDAETQAVLDTLVDSLPAARLFLLTTYRPEYRQAWGSKTYYTQLRLDPLPRESARELARALMGDVPELTSLTEHLIERTEGNPFFLGESIRSLVETQVLVGAPGAYRVAQAPPMVQVPATVQAVLAARIDRLPSEEKQLLQTAAVIGTEVPFRLVQAIAERPEEELRTGLAHLQGAELLYETSLFPELIYTFKHVLTQEVAYGSLLADRRCALHAQIVEAIERLASDQSAEQVERLAYHAFRGNIWEKALAYCRQAGEKAQNRGAFHEVVTYYEQALDALGHLPEYSDTGVLAIELHYRLGDMLSVVGEHARSLTLLSEAAARARQLGDRARLGGVLSRMVTVHRIVGDVAGALAAGQEALELAAALGDLALHVHASYRLGQAYTDMGDFRRAAEVLRGNVAALTCGMPGNMRVWCIKSQAWLAQVLTVLGEFAEGRRHGAEALRLAMRDGQWQSDAPIVAHSHLGRLHLAQGNLESAIRVFEEGLTLCRATGQDTSLATIVGCLGEAYAHTGRLAEGLALLEETHRNDLRTGRLGGSYVTHLWQLSAVYLLAGRVDESLQHAGQALDLARAQKVRGEEARALFQLSAVQAHTDPAAVTQAEAHYRQAHTLASELGMRPLVAHCHRGLGTLYAKAGRPQQARGELATAIELYRAMDMTFWLPRAEAILAQIQG
jgi:class 3 adenylate cyclase/DNA-binding winged helix-turn-helix (wHTH) protein/tetratricopeptide (TPR) repeat protein